MIRTGGAFGGGPFCAAREFAEVGWIRFAPGSFPLVELVRAFPQGHLVHLTVYKEFKNIARSLGYENTRFHDLRHSYAVAAIESGDDIKTVQTNLGHATASFTLDIYGHASQKMRQQSADRMERYIKSVISN